MLRIFAFLLFIVSVVAASEHSGAYSSPQYAKKMFPKQDDVDMSSFLPREKASVMFRPRDDDYGVVRRDGVNYSQPSSPFGRSSILESAGSFLSGAGGQVVTSLAKDFIARSTGSSQVGFDCITQVLSLNLTNLVILVVLKALILAAGFFGAGAWKGGHHYARSLEDNKNTSYITEDEVLLYLSFLSGQQSQDYGCLYRLSCEKPKQAALYSSGAELLVQGTKLLNGPSNYLESYEDIAEGIKKAAAWGQEGLSCDNRYQCGD